jgi:hypothetical protein
MALTYKHEGIKHPLIEADYDTAFKVYKSDRRKAVIGDPTACIEAVGLKRLPNVSFAHIGSGGDAYVGFKDQKSSTGITVRHFTIPAQAKKVRDQFEVKGAPNTQTLLLKAPSNGRTLSHRKVLGKRRRDEIKAGAEVKKRAAPRASRIARIGVAHRPRAQVDGKCISLDSSE